MRILKMLLLVILVLSLAACAPAAQPEPAASAAATPVPVDEAEGVDLRIEVESAFIANTLAEQLAEPIDVPGQPGVQILLEEPDFALVPGDLLRVTSTINADVYGIEAAMRPTISLRLAVVDGQIDVAVAGVALGDVQFPLDAVQDQLTGAQETLRTQLASALQGVTDATGLQVKGLLVTEEALVLDMGRE